MAKVSVLIPSRNESYLNQTIQSCFDNARGDLEVVVCLEGYWPGDWKDITAKYPRLHTVHHGEPRGLRAAINSAAASAMTRGADYLFKLDAHCMLDEGFDVKLCADMEPNWVVVPRRKRLDAENWVIKDVGKPDVDYHYLSFPDDPNDFGGPGLNGRVWDERIQQRLGKPEYDVDDEMASQGSAWFLASSYFQELELMDETHYGKFWNESQELLLKCWLSGGRGVINKKTWYAHLHKSRSYKGLDGKGGRGYNLPESWLKQGASFTKKWIWNEAWPKQTLPFKWLIEHFWPVPGWGEDWEEVLYAERKPRVVVTGATLQDVDDPEQAERDAEFPPLRIGKSSLQIRFAWYGHGPVYTEDAMDVTARVRQLVKDNSLDIVVNNSTLTPGQNPYRGKKKKLWVAYNYDGGPQQDVIRDEKDWLIIGQPARDGANLLAAQSSSKYNLPPRTPSQQTVLSVLRELDVEAVQHMKSATALNDYLIRKFSISDRRLRGPMPIELRDFHRDDLAALFAELGFKRGAEIGVAEGHYSEVLCKSIPNLEELLLVDPWRRYDGNPWAHSQEHQDFSLNETKRKTAGYNVRIMQDYSMNAVWEVEEGSLDFCYVDAHHGYDWVSCDLIEWSKRVRSGGIVSGDDYYHFKKSWAGVVEAVNAYTDAHRISPWFLIDAPRSVDFFWVKP